MLIEDIRLINFRNYDDLYIKLNKNINIFVGNNAQGKTNLLESIYIAALGSSFRTNRDREIINFDKTESYIGLNYISNKMKKMIEIKMDEEKPKRIKINRLEIKNLKELQSGLNVVLFSPDDLVLVKGGPGERRNFLNNSISELKPVYKHNLSRYNKILYQRNNILKSKKSKEEKKSLIEIFNLQLVSVGADIILYRKSYLDNLNKIANKIHKNLTLGKEELELSYETNLNLDVYNKDYIEEVFLSKLSKTFERDSIIGTTEIGPHRDDFSIIINDINARSFGSQGQQRTIVLSMKLSEIEIIYFEKGEYPVLLLDDVFSELDKNRREYLTNFLKKTQTIITSTDLMEVDEIKDIGMSVFKIDKGKVKYKG